MSAEEKELVVLGLDHDARQPQHSLEMALRALQLIATDLEASRLDAAEFTLAVRRLKAEIASVGAGVRQVVDTQQDLIDAIRLEFENTQPCLRAIRASELLERVQRSNRAIAGSVDIRVPRCRLTFVSDERWLERILNNLIVNALYHSEATKILLSASLREGGIVFDVRDNGRGMSREKVATAFQAIVVNSARTIGRSAARIGLGLYNVRLFATRLGGSVSCDSAPGRGSRFSVRLPGPVDREERQPRFTSYCGMLAGAGKKLVAILDDDRTVLSATKSVFESQGIDVYADHDPLRWLSVITDLKRPPDLTLLDYQLKGQDCSLHLDIVRRKWGDERPKVILITGHHISESLERMAEVVPVMQKPLGEERFRIIIEVLSGCRALPEAGFL